MNKCSSHVEFAVLAWSSTKCVVLMYSKSFQKNLMNVSQEKEEKEIVAPVPLTALVWQNKDDGSGHRKSENVSGGKRVTVKQLWERLNARTLTDTDSET